MVGEAQPAAKRPILGGSGGMPPQKIFFNECTEVHFGTFWKRDGKCCQAHLASSPRSRPCARLRLMRA